MNDQVLIDLLRKTAELTFSLSAPLLFIGLVVGVGISIVQVATSIQDSTLSFIPRIIAIGIMGFVTLPWMLHKILTFTQDLFSQFIHYVD